MITQSRSSSIPLRNETLAALHRRHKVSYGAPISLKVRTKVFTNVWLGFY